MRVHVYSGDLGGCGYYRLRWPAQALIDQGADVVLHDLGDTIAGVYVDTPEPVLIGANPPADADVIVLQRVLQRDICDLIPHLQDQGVAVVVEIDDDFHSLHPSNPAYDRTDPAKSPMSNRDVLMEACRRADLVTCSTPGLAKRYAPHSRVEVIPNYCRAGWLDLEPVPEPATVGWTGAVSTHRADLAVLAGAMPDALPWGWKFRAMGADGGADAIRRAFGLGFGRYDALPWADLTTDDYPLGIGTFTMGVVPLERSKFNAAKSWLKGIEYAAMGVPFVASDVRPYRDLAKLLTVPLARATSDWKLGVTPQERADVGGANREAMRDLTIEGNADRWLEAWTRAARRRRTQDGNYLQRS